MVFIGNMWERNRMEYIGEDKKIITKRILKN